MGNGNSVRNDNGDNVPGGIPGYNGLITDNKDETIKEEKETDEDGMNVGFNKDSFHNEEREPSRALSLYSHPIMGKDNTAKTYNEDNASCDEAEECNNNFKNFNEPHEDPLFEDNISLDDDETDDDEIIAIFSKNRLREAETKPSRSLSEMHGFVSLERFDQIVGLGGAIPRATAAKLIDARPQPAKAFPTSRFDSTSDSIASTENTGNPKEIGSDSDGGEWSSGETAPVVQESASEPSSRKRKKDEEEGAPAAKKVRKE